MLRNYPDRAVKFGEAVDMGLGAQKAYPFIYSFVNVEDDEWQPGQTGLTNLIGMGPAIPAGGTVRHFIRLNPDFNYKLLWLKYSVYYWDEQNGIYVWYEPIGGWFQEQGDYQTMIGTPLVNSIKVSLSAQAPSTRYIYGGAATDALRATALLPLDLECVQGYDYGYAQLHTPHLLPREGQLLLEITNTHTIKTLLVTGLLHGMKVRI